MNVAFGGTLYQDLPTQHSSSVNHRQEESGTTPTHPISIIKESKLAEITGQEVLQVNTFHHQGTESKPFPELIRDEKVNPRSQNPKGFPRVYCILSSSPEADRSFSTADFSHKKQPSGTVC